MFILWEPCNKIIMCIKSTRFRLFVCVCTLNDSSQLAQGSFTSVIYYVNAIAIFSMRWIWITIAKLGVQPILEPNGNHNGPLGVIHTWDIWGVNYCVNWNRGTEPIIIPLSSHNSSCSCKREYAHVVQYNLLRYSSCLINHRCEWFLKARSNCDLLGVNYCVNFSVYAITNNGYTTHCWTFQST